MKRALNKDKAHWQSYIISQTAKEYTGPKLFELMHNDTKRDNYCSIETLQEMVAQTNFQEWCNF